MFCPRDFAEDLKYTVDRFFTNVSGICLTYFLNQQKDLDDLEQLLPRRGGPEKPDADNRPSTKQTRKTVARRYRADNGEAS
jgi:hypothetical protein